MQNLTYKNISRLAEDCEKKALAKKKAKLEKNKRQFEKLYRLFNKGGK